MRPAFPIEVRGDEWPPESVHGTAEELGANIEYVDDYDPPYEAWDAATFRVRLIVWDLELLVAQIVPDDFAVSRLNIRVGQRAPNTVTYQEVVQGRVTRTLCVHESGSVASAEPIHWDKVLTTEPVVDEATISPREFHAMWMRTRTGRRWP